MREYQEWDVDPKPQLILSIGEEQSGLEWKALVANGFHASFVGNVKKVSSSYFLPAATGAILGRPAVQRGWG